MTSVIDTHAPLPVTVHGMTSDDSHGYQTFVDFIGGCAGGTASVLVGQPLDTVKVKIQTFPSVYRNSVACFVSTLRTEGVLRGLYAGTAPSLVAQVSENAVLLAAYGLCQKAIATARQKPDAAHLTFSENALAGAGAGFCASIVLCPTELIKCKQQAMREMRISGQLLQTSLGAEPACQRNSAIGAWSLTKQVLQQSGVRGLYRGFVPTYTREMFGYFFFFGGYELCRTALTPTGGTKEDLSPVRTIICGGMGGIAFWTATYPIDVIKSRVQVQTTSTLGGNASIINMLQDMLRNEGLVGIYRGLAPCLLRTFPATGALFLAYETTKKLLRPVTADL